MRIFRWKNTETGEEKVCGALALSVLYNLDKGHLYKVANGRRKHHKHWIVAQEFDTQLG